MNGLARMITELVNKSNDFLNVELKNEKEVAAQNELRNIVNQLSPIDSEFQQKSGQIEDHLKQIKIQTQLLINYAQQSSQTANNLLDLVNSL